LIRGRSSAEALKIKMYGGNRMVLSLLDYVGFFGLIVIVGIVQFLINYFVKKGENLATKEDIGVITKEIETVRGDIRSTDNIKKSKWELLYEACLESFDIIDITLQPLFEDSAKLDIRYERIDSIPDTIRARRCHTKLMLSCSNTDLIEQFSKICFLKSPLPEVSELMGELNKYRNLVRKELNYDANDIEFSTEHTWFAAMVGDKKK
jgi:hypothetical protein